MSPLLLIFIATCIWLLIVTPFVGLEDAVLDAALDAVLENEDDGTLKPIIVRSHAGFDDAVERALLRAESVRLPWDTEASLRAQYERDEIDSIEYSLRVERL